MNLLFFTPATQRSAIGRMAALVVAELVQQGHAVTVVRTESPELLDEPARAFAAPVLPWTMLEQQPALGTDADIHIHQIGNNHPFHEGSLHALAHKPGLVCLHDFYLGDLFHGWARTRQPQAERLLHSWYGREAANRFFQHTDAAAFREDTRTHAPLTEWISAQALGVITHSHWGCPRVLAACGGPVQVVPLPYDAQPSATRALPAAHGRLRLLTVGHVNANKRAAQVIAAIGSHPLLRARVDYQVMGAVEPGVRAQLSALAAQHGVALTLTGTVNDDTLAAALAACDAACCLRWPAFEAASASVIEAMLHGKPVLCTDTGFYSELPDTCTYKVSPEAEQQGITQHLLTMLENPMQREQRGQAARHWASRTFTATGYAQALVEMVILALQAEPVLAATRHFAGLAGGWSAHPAAGLSAADLAALRVFE